MAKSLNLSYNQIDSEGVAILEEYPWDNLEELNLSHNPIGDEGLKFFSKFCHLSKLYLQDCSISAEGLKTLSEFNYTKLSFLNISKHRIMKTKTQWAMKEWVAWRDSSSWRNCIWKGQG